MQFFSSEPGRRYAQTWSLIAGIKPAQITDAFAVGVSGQLTSSEVTDALGFYESKAGQGFTQSRIDRLRLPPGTVTGTDYVMRYMTADQVLEMKEFVQKPVARKLMVDKITEQESVINGVQRRLIELMQECVRKPGGVITEALASYGVSTAAFSARPAKSPLTVRS